MSDLIPFDLTQYIVEANQGLVGPTWRQIILRFPNNFGVSIIKGGGTYTTLDTFEVAILDFNKSEIVTITYETPFAQDVLAYQTGEEVRELLYKIMAYDGKKVLTDGK